MALGMKERVECTVEVFNTQLEALSLKAGASGGLAAFLSWGRVCSELLLGR